MWGKQHAPKRTWYPLFHPELVSNILKRRCAYPNGFRWPELKKKRREKQKEDSGIWQHTGDPLLHIKIQSRIEIEKC